MIILKSVTKKRKFAGVEQIILDEVSATIPTDRRVAVMGLAGSGKSTLIYLLAGIDRPSSGEIERRARLSFPVGYGRSIKSTLSMRQNVMFAARIYDADPAEVANFVETSTGLSHAFDVSVKKLPMQIRQSFLCALSYAIPFDTYLIDGPIANGTPEFKTVGLAMFEARARTSGIIMSVRNARVARQCCDMGIVITDGKLRVFDDLEEAIDLYESHQDDFGMQRDHSAMTDHLDLESEPEDDVVE